MADEGGLVLMPLALLLLVLLVGWLARVFYPQPDGFLLLRSIKLDEIIFTTQNVKGASVEIAY